MTDEERFALRCGPYAPPSVQVGEFLDCEVHGPVQVGRWSEGRIPWPQARNPHGGGWMKVVCGDLARAVRSESNQAVVFWFGGNGKTVSQWRRALRVPNSNPGTVQLRRAWVPHMIPAEAALLGQQRSLASDARHVARPRKCKVNLKGRHPNARVWQPAEAALLGTLSDRSVAAKLGCSLTAVVNARRERGIAPCCSKAWNTRRQRGASKGGGLIELDPAKLLARRVALNLPQKAVGARTGTPAYYAKLESGISVRVTAATLDRVAGALECRPHDLRREADKNFALERHEVQATGELGC